MTGSIHSEAGGEGGGAGEVRACEIRAGGSTKTTPQGKEQVS